MSQPLLPLMFLRPRLSQNSQSILKLSRHTRFRMPLRARITNPEFSTQAIRMSEQDPAEDSKESLPEAADDVLFNSHYGVRTIELNRPAKLHALNGSMVQKLQSRLLEWQKSDMANVIIISSSQSSPKAFCVGGDVASLVEQNRKGPNGWKRSQEFFGKEYTLDHLIATYNKPFIAYMDGITMGGGVGLSVHAPIRIATENTLVAMPETSIGLFPDVGGSFFLPRLDGSMGTYLALTSARLMGIEAFYGGFATHFIDSATLPNLTARLAELQFKDYDDLPTRLELVNATIAEYDTGFPSKKPSRFVGELRRIIDRCFSNASIELIFEALARETENRPEEDPIKEWAHSTLRILFERSPTSLRVTLRQMQLGRNWSIGETFQHEFELAGKFMQHHDFNEGVTHKLIDKSKDPPMWDPPNLEEVSEDTVDTIFEPEVGTARLQLTKTGIEDYREYPHSLGLPRESEIEASVRHGGKSKNAILRHFLKTYDDKAGVKEKITEVLDRCCSQDDDNNLMWNSEP